MLNTNLLLKWIKNFHFVLYCRNILYLCKCLEQVTDNYEYISYTYFARRYYYSIGETSGK